MPLIKFSCRDLSSKNNVIDKNKTLSKYCSKEQETLLVKNMSCIFLKQGEIIFHEDQPVLLIYFIYSGIIKLWKEGVHKDEQVIRFAKEGEAIGFWGCLENENYSLSASAMTDTNVCYVKKEIFFDIFRNDYKTLFHLSHEYIIELKKIESHIRNMAEMNVREKVAKAILTLLSVFGNDMNSTNLKIVLSRHEIASIAGLNIDSVSKQLAEFKREKVIGINNNIISIDQKALKKIILPYNIIDSNG